MARKATGRGGYVVAGLTVVLTAVIWFFAMRGGA